MKGARLSDIRSRRLLAKGKRGVIFTGFYKGHKVSIKKQRPDIPVTWSVDNEAEKLKMLNRKGIGPKLLWSGSRYIVYVFVEGMLIPQFIEESGKAEIKEVLEECLRQCFVMDKMGLNKEELTNPYKHIIVGKKGRFGRKVTMIDFERCKSTEKPCNVTQFLQYIMSSRISSILKNKGFKINRKKIIGVAKRYKKRIDVGSFACLKRTIFC